MILIFCETDGRGPDWALSGERRAEAAQTNLKSLIGRVFKARNVEHLGTYASGQE
jgi:hypothetical protein